MTIPWVINSHMNRKSQYALEYCYQFKEVYPEALVFWVAAASTARIEQGFLEIAKRLRLPTSSESARRIVEEWLRLQSGINWLLVLDDYSGDDATLIFDTTSQQGAERPSNSSTVLLQATGKRGHSTHKSTELYVLKPDVESAASMLRKKVDLVPSPDKDVQDLVEILHLSPLAITVAAAYIRENELTVEQYLGTHKTFHSEWDHDVKDNYKSSFRTFMLSLQQIASEDSIAIEILALATVLDRQILPASLLYKVEYGVRAFYRAMRKLQAFSFVTGNEFTENYYMDHSIQAMSAMHLYRQGKLDLNYEHALALLKPRFGNGDSSSWLTCRVHYPHAIKTLRSPTPALRLFTELCFKYLWLGIFKT